MKEDQNTKKNWISDVIGHLLLIQGILVCFSGVIWAISGDTTDKWFSRLLMGVICFGFSGVILKLRK